MSERTTAIEEAEESLRLSEERYRAISEALQASEERYRELFASSPNPMWIYDTETLRFLAVNDAALDRYGYTRDEFLAMTIKDIRLPEDVARLIDDVEATSEDLARSRDWRHVTKAGQIVDVEITSHRLEWDGRPTRLVVINDVTERLRAEAALRESERRFRALATAAPVGISRWTSGGHARS